MRDTNKPISTKKTRRPASVQAQENFAKKSLSNKKKTGTQENEVQEWFASFPVPTTIEADAVDLSVSSKNNYTSIIQSVVAQIMVDLPDNMTMSAGPTFPTISPASLANYLNWLCLSLLRDRGLLTGPDVYLPTFAKASEELFIPVPLAKMLEYMMPYEDSYTGNTYQTVYYAPAFAYGTTGNLAIVNSGADSWVCVAPDANSCVYVMQAASGSEYKTTTVTYAGFGSTATLAKYIEKQNFFNNFLGGLGWCTSLKEIPKNAPDASFYALVTSDNQAFSATPNFDGEMAFVWNYSTTSSYNFNKYFLPFAKSGVFLRTLKGSQTDRVGVPSQIQDIAYDAFAHLLSRCPYVRGKIKKSLKLCKYGKVKTLCPTYYVNDTSALRQAIAQIYSSLPAGVLDETDLVVHELMAYSALVSRTASYGWFGSKSYMNMNQLFHDPTFQTCSFHPIISQIISRVGPIVAPNGQVIYPLLCNLGVTTGSYQKPGWYYRMSTLNRWNTVNWVPFHPSVVTITTGALATSKLNFDTSTATTDAGGYGLTPYSITQNILSSYQSGTVRKNMNVDEIPLFPSKMGDLSSFCLVGGHSELNTLNFSLLSVTGTATMYSIKEVFNMILCTDISVLKQGIYYYGASNFYDTSSADASAYAVQKLQVSFSSNPLATMVEFMASKYYQEAVATSAGNMVANGNEPEYYSITNNLTRTKFDTGVSNQVNSVEGRNYWNWSLGWSDSNYNHEINRLTTRAIDAARGGAEDVVMNQISQGAGRLAFTGIGSLMTWLAHRNNQMNRARLPQISL